MNRDSRYKQAQTAKEYEKYYENRYKRADLLEKRLLTKLLSQFKNPKSLLDIGCGTGHFTRWMETTGLECYGVDTSISMLREAKKMWTQGQLFQSEGSSLPFKDKSIDIITYVTSLEFMPDSAVALLEAARVAKKGIVMGLINKNSPATIRKRLQTTQKHSFYENAHFYSISNIKNILEKTLSGKYTVTYWNTTVFPRVFGNLESSLFPFGAFLGIAVGLRGTYE